MAEGKASTEKSTMYGVEIGLLSTKQDSDIRSAEGHAASSAGSSCMLGTSLTSTIHLICAIEPQSSAWRSDPHRLYAGSGRIKEQEQCACMVILERGASK